MDFLSTFKGSYAGSFYPAGWDYAKIQKITALGSADFHKRQPHWHKDFAPVICEDGPPANGVETMNAMMGYEITFNQIRETARSRSRELALILPVGPMGMYRWVIYFCRKHNVS